MAKAKNYVRIGISACFWHKDPSRLVFNGRPLYYVEASLTEYLLQFGALAYVIPPTYNKASSYRNLVGALDALVLQGGVDISPTNYGEKPLKKAWAGDLKRDQYELALVKEFHQQNKPILGICRGHQLLNVAFGGSLYQDIKTFVPKALTHRDAVLYDQVWHEVKFSKDGLLAKIYKNTRNRKINSVHHQAVKELGKGLVIDAISPKDNVVEAILLKQEKRSDPFCLGVQWHPEFHADCKEKLLDSELLLKYFLREVKKRKGVDGA